MLIVNSQCLYADSTYRSVLVVGHLYPLYETYGQDRSLASESITLMADEIYNITNVDRLVLLGDTYVDDRNEVYELVNDFLIRPIGLPVTTVYGNHEVANLEVFRSRANGVGSGTISINGINVLFFSPWRYIGGVPRMVITDEDIAFFDTNLSSKEENIILITDMVHHNNAEESGWREKIVPLLKSKNVRYVVVGDNDQVDHKYSWVKLDEITYIHQGISHNFYSPNMNSFLEIQIYSDGNVKFVPHTVPLDGLSNMYNLNKMSFLSRRERCDYSNKYSFPMMWHQRQYCRFLYLIDVIR